MTTPKIEYPPVVSRAAWLEARKNLLAKEKELTHLRDQLNTERRLLPMMHVDQPYFFEGPQGKAGPIDLFEGRQQLIIDLIALGRQEEWEEPKGRATGSGAQAGSDEIRYPDEY